jgi:hypothetical protein
VIGASAVAPEPSRPGHRSASCSVRSGRVTGRPWPITGCTAGGPARSTPARSGVPLLGSWPASRKTVRSHQNGSGPASGPGYRSTPYNPANGLNVSGRTVLDGSVTRGTDRGEGA